MDTDPVYKVYKTWRTGLYSDKALAVVSIAVRDMRDAVGGRGQTFDYATCSMSASGEVVIVFKYDIRVYKNKIPMALFDAVSMFEQEPRKQLSMIASRLMHVVKCYCSKWERGCGMKIDAGPFKGLGITVGEAYDVYLALRGSRVSDESIVGVPFDPVKTELRQAFIDEVERINMKYFDEINEASAAFAAVKADIDVKLIKLHSLEFAATEERKRKCEDAKKARDEAIKKIKAEIEAA